MNHWQEYWQRLQPREQLALKIVAGFLSLALVYLLILDPVYSAHQQAQQQLLSTRQAWGELQQKAALIVPGKAVNKTTTSLVTLIESSANRFQLRQSLSKIRPQSDKQTLVSVENTSYPKLMNWLINLQEQGATAVKVSLTVANAETLDAEILFQY